MSSIPSIPWITHVILIYNTSNCIADMVSQQFLELPKSICLYAAQDSLLGLSLVWNHFLSKLLYLVDNHHHLLCRCLLFHTNSWITQEIFISNTSNCIAAMVYQQSWGSPKPICLHAAQDLVLVLTLVQKFYLPKSLHQYLYSRFGTGTPDILHVALDGRQSIHFNTTIYIFVLYLCTSLYQDLHN